MVNVLVRDEDSYYFSEFLVILYYLLPYSKVKKKLFEYIAGFKTYDSSPLTALVIYLFGRKSYGCAAQPIVQSRTGGAFVPTQIDC